MVYINYKEQIMHPSFEYSRMKYFTDYPIWDESEREAALQLVVKSYKKYEGRYVSMDELMWDIFQAITYFEELEEYELCMLFRDLHKIGTAK